MNDFDLLGFPASLLLTAEQLDDAWHQATLDRHPDRHTTGSDAVQDDFQKYNQARATLKDPVSRLEHWLTVHQVPVKKQATLSPALLDLFTALNDLLHQVDAYLRQHHSATNAILRAALAKQGIQLQLQLQTILRQVQEEKNRLLQSYPLLEEFAASQQYEPALQTLAELKFLSRWEQQCTTRLVELIGLE